MSDKLREAAADAAALLEDDVAAVPTRDIRRRVALRIREALAAPSEGAIGGEVERRDEPEGWQDIETAPRDGTWVFGMGPGWWPPAVMQWSRMANCWQGFDREIRPAHWMRIPRLKPAPSPPGRAGSLPNM